MKSNNRLEVVIPLLLICMAQLAISLAYVSHMQLPLIHADEGGYLLNALAIAGQANGGSGLDYYAGFSLLLAPFALGGATSAYKAALIMNSVFVAAMPLAYWIMLRRVFPALATGHALLVVAFASFFPSHFVLAHLAFSDNFLIFAFGFAFVCFILANERSGGSRWLLAAIAGILLGWCFLANPRGIVNGMALVGVACVFSLKHGSLRGTSLVMAAAWLLCILAHPFVEGLALKQASSDAGGYSVSALLDKLLTPESLWKSLRNFIGVSTYVSIATLGLAFALLFPVWQALGKLVSKKESGEAVPDLVLTATLASVVGSILLTALFFQEFLRIDHLFYGRYVASSLAPCVLLGAGALLDRRARPIALAFGVVLTLTAILFLRQAYAGIALPTGLAPFNVVEIFPFVSTDGVFRWSQLVIAILAGAGIFLSLYAFKPSVAIGFGLCLYLGMGFVTSERFLWRQAAQDAPLLKFVGKTERIITSSRKPVCVDIDPQTDTWHVIHYRLYFSRHIGLPADDAGGRSCVRAILAPSSVAENYFRKGYRALAQDVRQPNLFMLNGKDLPLGMGLAGKGMGVGILKALPAVGRRASLHVDALSPNPVAAGEKARLWVTIKNESSQPWPRFNQSNPLPGAVRLGARFTSVESPERKIPELRAELPMALLEGEEVKVMLELPGTLSPGRYIMNVNLVNDGVTWFDCPSKTGCDYDLIVGPASLVNCALGRGGCRFLMDARQQ